MPKSSLTAHLRDALAYAAGLRMLLDARERGELADSTAPEREIQRIERAIAHVIGLIEGTP